MSIDFELARFNLVEQQVRPWEVLDTRVLDVMTKVRREDFVQPRHRKLAFSDVALPLEHGEFMMKPVVEGRMLQALELGDGDEVLEIGTGSGFITACLCNLARAVVSIDIHGDFVSRARARLQGLSFNNVRIEQADALDFRPGKLFDAVCVTAAVAEIPAAFSSWLRPGGRLFFVQGHSPAMEAMLVRMDGEGRMRSDSLFETDIPYLRGAEPRARFVL
jgi:protein-L-isoaspartate(D-aspartate) O-methyltransferase